MTSTVGLFLPKEPFYTLETRLLSPKSHLFGTGVSFPMAPPRTTSPPSCHQLTPPEMPRFPWTPSGLHVSPKDLRVEVLCFQLSVPYLHSRFFTTWPLLCFPTYPILRTVLIYGTFRHVFVIILSSPGFPDKPTGYRTSVMSRTP